MFKRVYNKLKDIQEKRVAYWQLNSLSDKALKDIGINRSEIRSIVYNKS